MAPRLRSKTPNSVVAQSHRPIMLRSIRRRTSYFQQARLGFCSLRPLRFCNCLHGSQYIPGVEFHKHAHFLLPNQQGFCSHAHIIL